MFYLKDGRKELWQWDTDCELIVEDSSITEVHFANKSMSNALVCEVKQEEDNRVVSFPNILLQSFLDIRVFAYGENHTKYEKIFIVRKRPKPDNYIYTETEIFKVEEMKEIILEQVEEMVRDACSWGHF